MRKKEEHVIKERGMDIICNLRLTMQIESFNVLIGEP